MGIDYTHEFKVIEQFVKEHWGINTELARSELVRRFSINPARVGRHLGMLQVWKKVYLLNNCLYPPERVESNKICIKCGRTGYGYYTAPFRVRGIWYERDLFAHYTKGKRTFCYIRGSCRRKAEKIGISRREEIKEEDRIIAIKEEAQLVAIKRGKILPDTNIYKQIEAHTHGMEEKKDTIGERHKASESGYSSEVVEKKSKTRGVGNDLLLQRGDRRGTGEVRGNVSGSEGLRESSSTNTVEGQVGERLANMIKDERERVQRVEQKIMEKRGELPIIRGDVAFVDESLETE